jgi:hypothetical protein
VHLTSKTPRALYLTSGSTDLVEDTTCTHPFHQLITTGQLDNALNCGTLRTTGHCTKQADSVQMPLQLQYHYHNCLCIFERTLKRKGKAQHNLSTSI